jgi:hypothetical protein
MMTTVRDTALHDALQYATLQQWSPHYTLHSSNEHLTTPQQLVATKHAEGLAWNCLDYPRADMCLLFHAKVGSQRYC